MAKMKIYIKEIVRHEVTLDSEEFDLDDIQLNLNSYDKDNYAGDFCDIRTIEDKEWELEDYKIINNETNQSTPKNNT